MSACQNKWWVCILALLVLSVCQQAEPERAQQTEETKQMAQRLAEIAAATEADPRSSVHANKARVRKLREITPPTEQKTLASYKATLGQELLHAGENEAAIDTFLSILDLTEKYPALFSGNFALAVKDLLAISYLRLGEQENCIENHNIDRCLWPIREDGVHTRERGSRNAIDVYTEILNADPDDLNARWLLNVAYMTLGEYPDGVPDRWRIPPDALESEYDIGRFRDVSIPLGLDVVGLSGGAIMEDFNGDGLLDVLASSWGLRDPLKYFESKGDGTFADRTEAAGLTGLVGGLNLVHGDYDNDGYPDVLVLRGAWLNEGQPNSLLHNNSDGTFSDVTASAGMLTAYPTQTAAWGDYNNDGWLDLFIGNESSRSKGRNPCELYRNNGDGTFTSVAAQVGVDALGYFKAAVWGDYNNDGRLDLYLSDWERPNLLFRNDGPDGENGWRFTEVGEAAGVREPVESFPAWFWDYDNDGWLDLFVSGWRASAGDVAAEYLGLPRRDVRPRLYRNNGDGTFANVTTAARLDRVMYTMGSNFGDLDNDGWLDFYIGTGDPDFRSLMPNRMFRNADGSGSGAGSGRFFQDVTASGGFGHLQKGHGVAFGDLDNDGDQDVYATIGGAYEGDVFNNVLFENPGHGNHWITLRLEGTTSNRSAIGARIRLDLATSDGPRTVYATVSSGGSFGASSLQQEIGLGQATAITALEITWPVTGQVQRFEEVPVNRIVQIREGEDTWQEVMVEPFDLSAEMAQGHTGHKE